MMCAWRAFNADSCAQLSDETKILDRRRFKKKTEPFGNSMANMLIYCHTASEIMRVHIDSLAKAEPEVILAQKYRAHGHSEQPKGKLLCRKQL